MSAAPRMATCPTCHGTFPAGSGMISVCPRCAERVLVPALDDEEDDDIVDLPASEDEPIPTVPIECKLCSSRYYATPQQVGDMLPCPDCHTFNVVQDPASRRKPESPTIPELSDDEDFKLSEPVDTPRYQALSRDALHFERAIRSEDGLDVKPVEPVPPPLPGESDTTSGETLAESSTFVKRPVPGYGTMDSEEDAYSLAEPTLPPAYAPIERGVPAPVTPQAEPSPPPRTTTAAPTAPAAPVAPPAKSQAATTTPAPAVPARPEDIVLFPEDLVPVDGPAPPAAAPPEEEVIELGDDEPGDPRPPEVRIAPPEQRAEYRPVHQLPEPDDPADLDDGSDFTASMKRILPQAVTKVTQAAENFNPYQSMKEMPPEIAVKRPFSSGVFSFLFQPWVLMRWIFLTVLMTIELWASGYVLSLLATGDGGMLTAVARIMGLLMYVFALLPAIIGAAVIGATSITILEETANGRDRIEGGGEFLSFEWLGGMVYIFAAAFVSGLPVALLVMLLNTMGLNAVLVAVLLYPCVFLLFPPILLSMLESDTVMTPLSGNMMRSFLPLARFWAIFYGLSLLMGFVGIVFLLLAYTFDIVSIVVAAAVTTAIPFLYFRLLGRMAMVYRDYVLATTPDEEEEEAPRTVRHVVR